MFRNEDNHDLAATGVVGVGDYGVCDSRKEFLRAVAAVVRDLNRGVAGKSCDSVQRLREAVVRSKGVTTG